MKKKLVAMLLVAGMTVGMLAGCGGKDNTLSDTKTQQETGTKEASSQTSEEQPQERQTLTIGLPKSENISSHEDNAFTKYLEDSLNIDIEFVYFAPQPADYTQQLTLMCTGNEKLPDVLWAFQGATLEKIKDLGDAGYFLDLNDLIKEYGTNFTEHMNALDETTQSTIWGLGTSATTGGFYAMPSVSRYTDENVQSRVYINQKWLDAVGKDMPTTIEELEDVLRAFATEDPNGNGVADEIPMLGVGNQPDQGITPYLVNAFVYMDAKNNFNVTDGKVWAPMATDEYRQALIWMNKMCKEGLFSDLSFSVTDRKEFFALYTPDDGVARTGIISGMPTIYCNPDSSLLDEYVVMPPLKDATGKGGYMVTRPISVIWSSMITKDCENVELAMKFLDFLYDDETVKRSRWGEKDVDWVESTGKDAMGEDAYIKRLNSQVYTSGASTWGVDGSFIANDLNSAVIVDGAEGLAATYYRLSAEMWQTLQDAKVPAQSTVDMIYTAEEQEVINEFKAVYREYYRKACSLFVTGEMDPNNDADWQKYLDELEASGQSKLMEATQSAFDHSGRK